MYVNGANDKAYRPELVTRSLPGVPFARRHFCSTRIKSLFSLTPIEFADGHAHPTPPAGQSAAHRLQNQFEASNTLRLGCSPAFGYSGQCAFSSPDHSRSASGHREDFHLGFLATNQLHDDSADNLLNSNLFCHTPIPPL